MAKKIYEVFNGGTDGRDSYSIGFFATKPLAEKASKNQGSMGVGDGSISEHLLYTTEDDYFGYTQQKLRETALKKLTRAEKKALNLL